MSNIEAFRNLPDIDFVDKSVEQLLEDMISEYEEAYYESTGKRKVLAPGDPVRIWLYSQALRVYGMYHLIDFSAKQNLLKYSEGPFLENLGARVGVKKDEPRAAIVTVRFTLSAQLPFIVTIPEGKRVSPENNVFFSTMVYAEIPIGATFVDVICECREVGEVGNNYTPGQINVLVDPVPYIQSVSNIDTSQGGAEEEDDDSLTEKIYLKPESFSVAGPRGAYIYFTKAYSQTIGDVSVTSPEANGEVLVKFILKNGDLPDAALIQGVEEYLSEDIRRPLTDRVIASAPSQVSYDINITYYISSTDASSASSIQFSVNEAVEEFKFWQKTKIGRDINPSELVSRIMKEGAKRVEIIAPTFLQLNPSQIAIDDTTTITYGGIEDE